MPDIYIFFKVISEVVTSYYLFSRHLYTYVESFDMCALPFGIGISDIYNKSPMGDAGVLYNMRYVKSY